MINYSAHTHTHTHTHTQRERERERLTHMYVYAAERYKSELLETSANSTLTQSPKP